MSKIYIAADHGGFALKAILKGYLTSHTVIDLGTKSLESVNYPDYAQKLADALKTDPDALGILICGTGLGMCMAVNRHQHIRAARCSTGLDAQLARQHNNANILVMPGRFIDTATADQIMAEFFSTDFEGGRHQKRIEKIPVK